MQPISTETPIVFIIEDDVEVADAIAAVCESQQWTVTHFRTAEDFIATDSRSQLGCLVLDLRLPGLSGLELQSRLLKAGSTLPVILVSGYADVDSAVAGMRNGAITLLQKPFDSSQLIAAIQEALTIVKQHAAEQAARSHHAQLVAALNRSELETAELIVAGKSNKQIAAIQGLSLRGVEDRRSRLMKHFGTRSLAEFVSVVKAAMIRD
ncbi:MAG: tmoT [Planctomycetaceae bacterium]|nr:tmoT [Planctomycetaceae bacterium]